MADAFRPFRRTFISWALGVILLVSVLPASARAVRVGVLFDGPAARLKVGVAALKLAAKAVYADDLVLTIAPQKQLDGNWSPQRLNAALDRLENDPQVDVVVTLGPIQPIIHDLPLERC